MNNLEIMGFTRVALKKLNIIIADEKFQRIITVEPDLVEVEFTDRYYTITNYGKCQWFAKEPVNEQGKEDE